MNTMSKIILVSTIVIGVNADSNLENFLKDKHIFAGTTLGYSHISTNKEDKQDSVLLTEDLSKNGFNAQLEIGKVFKNNIETSLNYQRIESDDVDMDNMFLSVKYRFEKDKFIPYLGINLGYSQLSWNKSPVNTQSNDTNSGTYLVGLNTGILYPFSKQLELNVNYQLNHLNHKAKLESNSSKSDLYHNYLSSLNIGFRYNF